MKKLIYLLLGILILIVLTNFIYAIDIGVGFNIGRLSTYNCYIDSDCDDNNIITIDTCTNPGTSESICNHEYNVSNDSKPLLFACPDYIMVFDSNGISNLESVNLRFSGLNDLNTSEIIQCNNFINNELDTKCFFKEYKSEITSFNNKTMAYYKCDLPLFNKKVPNQRLVFSAKDNNGLIGTFELKATICNKDSECDDNNQYTTDSCINPNTYESYCNYAAINCITNNDCGFTGFIEDEFCNKNDVFKNFQSSECINPGTVESNCKLEIKNILINDCGESYCENYSSEYCSNGNVKHSRMCHNKGCSNSACYENIVYEEETVESCTDYCLNGTCKTFICKKDLDCNDNNLITIDTCINPETPESICNHEYNGTNWCNGADVNKDTKVNSQDVTIVRNHFTSSELSCDISNNWCDSTDANKDKKVDNNDVDIIRSSYTGFSNPCFGCLNQCIYNQKRCNENNLQICGDWNSDYCLEWRNDYECIYGCSNGTCIKDTIPPEAIISYDPNANDIKIKGIDNLDKDIEIELKESCKKTGTLKDCNREYTLKDSSNNTLKIKLNLKNHNNQFLNYNIKSITYNEKEISQKFNYNHVTMSKTGIIQNTYLLGNFWSNSNYNIKKNKTDIRIFSDKKLKTYTKDGLSLVGLSTNNGNVKYFI